MAINAKLGEATVAVRASLKELDGDLASARKKIFNTLQGVGKTIGIATGAALGGAAYAMGDYAVNATLAAARVQEMTGVLKMLGERAGWSSGEVDKHIESMKEYGITTDAAIDLLGQFARYEMDAAEATDVARVAQDLAVLSGQDSSETLKELTYAIRTGSSHLKVFRDLGIKSGQAYEDYADQIGKTREELTQADRMQALVNATLEQGETVAGAYERAMEEPGKRMRSLRRHFYETSLAIGQQFLPAFGEAIGFVENFITTVRDLLEEGEPLNEMFGSLGGLVETVFGIITGGSGDVFENLADSISTIAARLGPLFDSLALFIGLMAEGQPLLLSFKLAFQNIIPEETMEKITGVIEGLKELKEGILNFLEPLWTWFSSMVETKDVLIALGIAVLSWLLPALWGIVSPILAGIAVIAGLSLVISFLRDAWENNWLGIRDTLTEVWEETLKPIFNSIAEIASVNIPIAIGILSDAWNFLLGALNDVMSWIKATLFPIFESLFATLAEVIPPVLESLADLWDGVLLPAIEAVWGFIKKFLMPIFSAVADIIGAVLEVAITALAGIFTDVLVPAITDAWEWLDDKLSPAFEWLADKVNTVVGWLETFAEKLRGLKDKLPDWLTPGSPTPLEIGLSGIGKQLRQLSRAQLPRFEAALRIDSPDETIFSNEALSGSEKNVTNNYYLTANYPQQSELSLMEQVRIREALA
jgi:phage-related protein